MAREKGGRHGARDGGVRGNGGGGRKGEKRRQKGVGGEGDTEE